jgi:hypothetical protein
MEEQRSAHESDPHVAWHYEHRERRDGGLADDGAGSASDLLQPLGTISAELDRPSLAVRLRVSTHRRLLDEELARGANPQRSGALALRARKLVGRRSREGLATGVENLLKYGERAPSVTNIAPLPRREILDARTLLVSLAERLRDARPVYARGAAMVSQLLRDGTGPAFSPGAGVALRRALAAATEALDGTYRDELASDR